MKRKYNSEKTTKAIKAVTQMPIRQHTTTEPFDIMQSEVVAWLVQQPEVLNSMFNYYKDAGAIVFDSTSQSWKGVET